MKLNKFVNIANILRNMNNIFFLTVFSNIFIIIN